MPAYVDPRWSFTALIGVLTLGVALLVATPRPAHAGEGPSCGDVITSNTRLDADITGCSGDGLIIGADNVMLDGRGHTISGSASFIGIVVDGQKNVRIKNVTVTSFGSAVRINDSTGVRLDRIGIGFTTAGLIEIRNSTRVTLNGSELEVSGRGGVAISDSEKTRVSRNVLGAADYGFSLTDSTKNRLSKNEIGTTYLGGFILQGTSDTKLHHNTVHDTTFDDGVQVDAGSTGIRLHQNRVDRIGDDSSGDGTSGTANHYRGNTCTEGSSPPGLCREP